MSVSVVEKEKVTACGLTGHVSHSRKGNKI